MHILRQYYEITRPLPWEGAVTSLRALCPACLLYTSTPEFLQLSFGLREDWGTAQVVFAAGSTQIDVYVYTEWTDACLLYPSSCV